TSRQNQIRVLRAGRRRKLNNYLRTSRARKGGRTTRSCRVDGWHSARDRLGTGHIPAEVRQTRNHNNFRTEATRVYCFRCEEGFRNLVYGKDPAQHSLNVPGTARRKRRFGQKGDGTERQLQGQD